MRIHNQALMLAVVFPVLCAHAQSEVNVAPTHNMETRTDVRGRPYEAVTNDPTGTRIYTLPNGLKVFLAQNRDEPRIRAIVTMRAGAAYDPSENTGLAHYLEHLLFNGTDSLGTLDRSREKPLLDAIEQTYEEHRLTTDTTSKRALLRRIDSLSVAAAAYSLPGEYRSLMSSIGAVTLNGFTSYDQTAFWCLIPSPSLEHYLRLECERLRNPALRNFQKELEIVYQEFNEQQDNVLARKREALHRQLFPGHPYGEHTVIGTAGHLRNPSIPAIRAYFERYYVPGNMALVLVGDLDFEKTMELVEGTFGKLVAKPVHRPSFPVIVQDAALKDTTVYGTAESVYIGFRFEGGSSSDVPYTMLTDLVLNNGFAGLMDIELNGKQQVASAGTTVQVWAEHSIHYMEGEPKEGQSLEEVRDLVLAQVDRIASGDFEEWVMRGAVNDLRKQETSTLSSSIGSSAALMNTYGKGQTWADRVGLLDAMSRITKKELMEFVRTRYTERCVVYLRKGEPQGLVRLAKPPITPTKAADGGSSLFAERLKGTLPDGPQPVFVDYGRAVKRATLARGVELSFVENTSNDLFELEVIFPMGSNYSRELAVAIGYLPLLGTEDRSMEGMKQAFYELGLQFSASCTADRIYLHLDGLECNAAQGIELIDELLAHVKADTAAYSTYVNGLLQGRSEQAANKNAVLKTGLLELALYGWRSPVRNVMSSAELRALEPAHLVRLIHELRDFDHSIFYYGKSLERASRFLETAYNARPQRTAPQAPAFTCKNGPSRVLFVDMDLVQANVILVVPGETFSAGRIGPANFISPYMDHVLFDRLRQTGGIAYNTSARYQLARDTTGPDHMIVQFSTQADKLPEALALVMSMLNELPGTQADLEHVREDQLKRYGAERVTGVDLFWNGERYRRWGVPGDARLTQYNYVQGVDLTTLRAFFNEHVAGRPIQVLVVGSRDHIDFKALSAYGAIEVVKAADLFSASHQFR